MKTINKFFVLLMLAMPFIGFTSCDDDESTEGKVEAITGSYNGDIKLLGVMNVGTVDIPIGKEDDTHANLNVAIDITFNTTTKINVAGKFVNEVSYASGKYTLKDDTENIGIKLTQGGTALPEMKKDVTVGGSVSGNIADLEITVPLSPDLLAGLTSSVPDNLKEMVAGAIAALPANTAGDKLVPVTFAGTKK